MGKAHKAPRSVYGRHYHVAAHAIERFRERTGDAHLDDAAVANAIDVAVYDAVQATKPEEVLDDNRPAFLAQVGSLTAFMRRDERGRYTVVTMLTGEQVANNRMTKWKHAGGMGTMAQALKGVAVPAPMPLAQALDAAASPSGRREWEVPWVAPATHPAQPLSLAPPAPSTCYLILDGETRIITMDPAKTLQELVDAGADAKSIRVFREVKTKVTLEIE